jgi:hypothetical protein
MGTSGKLTQRINFPVKLQSSNLPENTAEVHDTPICILHRLRLNQSSIPQIF